MRSYGERDNESSGRSRLSIRRRDIIATEEVTIARYRPELSSTASGQNH